MATFRKTLLALGGATALAIGLASTGAYAYGGLSSGDVADDQWLAYLQSTEHGGAGPGGGANLALPSGMQAPTECGDVLAHPAAFAHSIVRDCRMHRR